LHKSNGPKEPQKLRIKRSNKNEGRGYQEKKNCKTRTKTRTQILNPKGQDEVRASAIPTKLKGLQDPVTQTVASSSVDLSAV
jgi:hypothetical protein